MLISGTALQGGTDFSLVRSPAQPYWDQVAEEANGYLDLSCWAAPPRSGDQWNTLAMVMTLVKKASIT